MRASLHCVVSLHLMGIVLMATYETITVKILAQTYPSMYFVLLATSAEILLFSGLFTLSLLRHWKSNQGPRPQLECPASPEAIPLDATTPLLVQVLVPASEDFLANDDTSQVSSDSHWKDLGRRIWPARWVILVEGTSNAISSICLLYASNPVRTPVPVQLILTQLVIFPTFVGGFCYLGKTLSRYKLQWIGGSFLLLLTSLALTLVPVFDANDQDSLNSASAPSSVAIWSLLYCVGTLTRSLGNVAQEKYFQKVCEVSLLQKAINLASGRLVQCVCMGAFIWVDPFLGYTQDWRGAFEDSAQYSFSSPSAFFLIESFVLAYLLLSALGVSLNAISTNYNMVSAALVTPLSAAFFQIWPQWNPGLKYSWHMLSAILVCCLGSIVCWVKGEKPLHSPNSATAQPG